MLSLILVAAGSSRRFGTGEKKEYLPLRNGTVLSEAARVFLETLTVGIVCVAYPLSPGSDAQEREQAERALFADGRIRALAAEKNTSVIFTPGGRSRQSSVLNALKRIKEELDVSGERSDSSFCLIHDGARPFVSAETIVRCVAAARAHGAAAPALEPTDTQKEIDAEGFVVRHLARKNIAAIQTPQVFAFDAILSAHERAAASGKSFTDDSEVFDVFAESSLRTKIVPGDGANKKITYKSDFFSGRGGRMDIRTGLGYDKHLLVEGRRLVLGGVEIPSEKGEAGHSDGDALLHAITDALLGAAALGDIGSYFPSEDPKWKGADSSLLLRTVWRDVRNAGFSLGNLDCVIALEKPKFLPFRDDVRKSIARILDCDVSRVFVKAKTGEKTGEVGEGNAVHAFATALLTANR